MSHVSSSRIVLAEWKSELKIVLKADVLSKITRSRVDSSAQKLTSWSKLMALIVDNDISIPVARRVLSECDKGSDGVFSSEEVMNCWHLVDNEEILIMMSLIGNSGIANLYGTCGNLVAVQYASSLPQQLLLSSEEFKLWELKSKIAVALIEMAESLENTKYGTLMLCDFHRSNFGIVQVNNTLIAKSIDNDISFFKKYLLNSIIHNTNCTSDTECSFFECEALCKNGKCSGKLLTNNLQNLCRWMFLRTGSALGSDVGILHNPPTKVKKELDALLHICAHPLTPSTEISMKLAKQLKELLKKSMILD